MSEKIALVAAGTPAMTFGEKIADEQEVLNLVTNIIIEAFAMESGLLRAQAVPRVYRAVAG